MFEQTKGMSNRTQKGDSDMNKVVLLGNLTRDVEMRLVNGATPTVSFTIAINRRYASTNGERVADFIPVVAWRKTAELCAKYLSKGSKVVVVGSLQTRTYDANDGSKRHVTEVVADEVEFISTKSEQSQAGGQADNMPSWHQEQGKQESMKFTEVQDDELPF